MEIKIRCIIIKEISFEIMMIVRILKCWICVGVLIKSGNVVYAYCRY